MSDLFNFLIDKISKLNLEDEEVYCLFKKFKVDYSDYNLSLEEEIKINFKNVDTIPELLKNIEEGFEYYLFLKDRETTYDNKTKGGRIKYNLYDSCNNFKTFSFKDLNTKELFSSPFIRFFYLLSFLILVKESLLEDFKESHFIKAIEGISIFKLTKKEELNINLNIFLDENLEKDVLDKGLRFVSDLLEAKNITLFYVSNVKNGGTRLFKK